MGPRSEDRFEVGYRVVRSFADRSRHLDDIVDYQPRVPAFTSAGILDYVVERVVGLPTRPPGPFRRPLEFLRPFYYFSSPRIAPRRRRGAFWQGFVCFGFLDVVDEGPLFVVVH